jgi:hypothetical protein
MDDSEVQQLARELDAQVPKEDAKLLVYVDDDEGACEIIGNRQGYLRAAIEMLRASATPLGPGDSITSVDFSYLGNARSLIVKRLTRSEDIEAALPPLRVNSWKEKAFGVGCLVIFVFLVICALTGFGDVVNWFFRKLRLPALNVTDVLDEHSLKVNDVGIDYIREKLGTEGKLFALNILRLTLYSSKILVVPHS